MRVDGVHDAAFAYEQGEGRVTYDPARTTPDAFIAALREMTGFEAVVEGTPAMSMPHQGRHQ